MNKLFESFNEKLEKDLNENKVELVKDEFGMAKIIVKNNSNNLI